MPMAPMSAYDGSVYGYAPLAPGYALHQLHQLPPPMVAPMPMPMSGGLHRSDSTSEFNAAAFDGMLAASLRGGGGDAVDGRPSGRLARASRAQSLVDLSRGGGGPGSAAGGASRLGDYWRVESATAPSASAARMAYMVPATRSLDRRLYHRPRRAVSLADLHGLHGAHGMMPVQQHAFYPDAFMYPPAPMMYRGATSKTSLGAASDDFRRYRDVAL